MRSDRSDSRSVCFLALVWLFVFVFGGREPSTMICGVILMAAFHVTRALENILIHLKETRRD